VLTNPCLLDWKDYSPLSIHHTPKWLPLPCHAKLKPSSSRLMSATHLLFDIVIAERIRMCSLSVELFLWQCHLFYSLSAIRVFLSMGQMLNTLGRAILFALLTLVGWSGHDVRARSQVSEVAVDCTRCAVTMISRSYRREPTTVLASNWLARPNFGRKATW
jgi:hypothetical protein